MTKTDEEIIIGKILSNPSFLGWHGIETDTRIIKEVIPLARQAEQKRILELIDEVDNMELQTRNAMMGKNIALRELKQKIQEEKK